MLQIFYVVDKADVQNLNALFWQPKSIHEDSLVSRERENTKH